ncbi:MAG: hypothetical protein RIQ55_1194 [Pseudomonadota bacterium]|jgi:uncharacterized membrane protein YfcA
MPLDWTGQLILLLTAVVANFFSAISGGGVGLIQFPILIFLGLSFATALATHKVASVFLGVGAILRHLKESHLERRACAIILASGIPGVILGAALILKAPEKPALITLGLLTTGLGLYSIFKPSLGVAHTPRNWHGQGLRTGILGLFMVGFLNGSITSGSGLFLTIWLIRHFGMDYKRAVAYTLVLCGFTWNGTGALVMGLAGDIAWDWLPALIVGSVVGSYLGTHLALQQGNKLVKRAFETTTILIGLKLIFL